METSINFWLFGFLRNNHGSGWHGSLDDHPLFHCLQVAAGKLVSLPDQWIPPVVWVYETCFYVFPGLYCSTIREKERGKSPPILQEEPKIKKKQEQQQQAPEPTTQQLQRHVQFVSNLQRDSVAQVTTMSRPHSTHQAAGPPPNSTDTSTG